MKKSPKITNLQLAELLPKSFVHCPNQPVMSLIGVDQDHQIVGEPRIFDVGVLAIAGDLPRSLQHSIHLIEVEVTEQGRDYSALWNALLARSFQHDLQKMHDFRVINPLCHFFQQPVVPDIVKVGSHVSPTEPTRTEMSFGAMVNSFSPMDRAGITGLHSSTTRVRGISPCTFLT